MLASPTSYLEPVGDFLSKQQSALSRVVDIVDTPLSVLGDVFTDLVGEDPSGNPWWQDSGGLEGDPDACARALIAYSATKPITFTCNGEVFNIGTVIKNNNGSNPYACYFGCLNSSGGMGKTFASTTYYADDNDPLQVRFTTSLHLYLENDDLRALSGAYYDPEDLFESIGNSFAEMDIMKVVGDRLRSGVYENSGLDSYLAAKGGVSEQVSEFAELVTNSVTTASGVSGFLTLFQHVFSPTNTISANDDETVSFSTTDFSMDCSFILGWETILSAATSVVSAVVTAISPVIGMIVSGVGALVSSIASLFTENQGDVPIVNGSADSLSFAIPCFQGKQYIPPESIDPLKVTLSNKKSILFNSPLFSGFAWKETRPYRTVIDTPIDYYCVECFPSVSFEMTSEVITKLRNYVNTTAYQTGLWATLYSRYRTTDRTYRWHSQSTQDTGRVLIGLLYDLFDDDSQLKIAETSFPTENDTTRSMANRVLGGTFMWALTTLIMYNQDVSVTMNNDSDQLPYYLDLITGNNAESAMKLALMIVSSILDPRWTSDPRLLFEDTTSSSYLSWGSINERISLLRTNLTEQASEWQISSGIFSFLSTFIDTYDMQIAWSRGLANTDKFFYGTMLGSSNVCISPPKYKYSLAARAAITTAIVTAAAIAASVVAISAKRKFKKKTTERALKYNQAWEAYSSDPSDANYKALKKTYRKYNKSLKLSGGGYNTLSQSPVLTASSQGDVPLAGQFFRKDYLGDEAYTSGAQILKTLTGDVNV